MPASPIPPQKQGCRQVFAEHDQHCSHRVWRGRQVLLESLLNIEGIRLVALCDIWDYHLNEGARLLGKVGNEVRTYENYEDLLAKEKDLQAVVIATPDFCHASMTTHASKPASMCIARR